MFKKTRRTFSQEFKQQIVSLYLDGKPRVEIVREYELTASAFDERVKQSKTNGSFKEEDDLTSEQKELLELRKRNRQSEMENDVSKQAALIFGRKDK